jgi:hypothetical protein
MDRGQRFISRCRLPKIERHRLRINLFESLLSGRFFEIVRQCLIIVGLFLNYYD